MTCEAGFSLGFWCVRYYGIILMLGALAGGYLATFEVKRRGRNPEIVWDLLVYLIIGGVLGARLWHILTPPPSSVAQGITTYYYLTHPLDAVAIWKGGLGIPGTILGGLVGLSLYTRRHRDFGFLQWADIVAPGLALGQAIGRWGNYFNQEIYGAPTELPWRIFIDPAHRLAGFEDKAYYHPLFAYESILNLANMTLLLWITHNYRGRLKDGDVFNVYCIVYPVIRFGLDFLRLDASRVLSVNINQTMMAVVAVVATAVLVWRHGPGASPSPSGNGMLGDATLAGDALAGRPSPKAGSVGVPESTKSRRVSRRPSVRTKRPARRAGSKSA